MSTSRSWQDASTPPRYVASTSKTFTTSSRVDAMFDRRPPHVSFTAEESRCWNDSEEMDDECNTVMGSSMSRNSDHWDSNASAPCWTCRQTHRLRRALKRIEQEYVKEIQSLQQQLEEAVAQRAAAAQERNELLTSIDAAAAQEHLLTERRARALQLEVVESAKEQEKLRFRLQWQEQHGTADVVERWLSSGLRLLLDLEVTGRLAIESAAEDEAALLWKLQMVVTSSVSSSVFLPKHCNTPRGIAEGFGRSTLSVKVSRPIASDSSSTGLSVGSQRQLQCSPRPSQRSFLSPPLPANSADLMVPMWRENSEENDEAAAQHELCPSSPVEDDVARGAESAKKRDWQLERLRSHYEIQLADERALTGEMQAEMDDLIENELLLVESQSRIALERDAAEAFCTVLQGILEHVGFFERKAAGEVGTSTLNALSQPPAPATTTDRCGADPEAAHHGAVPTEKSLVRLPDGLPKTLADSSSSGEVMPQISDQPYSREMGGVDPAHISAPTMMLQRDVEPLMRQLQREMAQQRKATDAIESLLRRFSRVSTHNDDVVFRALARVETAIASGLAVLGDDGGPEVLSHSSLRSSTHLTSPRPTNVSQPSAQDFTTASDTASVMSPNQARDESEKRAEAPSASAINRTPFVVVPDEDFFAPQRIQLDTTAVVRQIETLLRQDTLSETTLGDHDRSPYDEY